MAKSAAAMLRPAALLRRVRFKSIDVSIWLITGGGKGSVWEGPQTQALFDQLPHARHAMGLDNQNGDDQDTENNQFNC